MNRHGFIGGSDAAAILGVSPWKSAVDLYLEKTEPQPERAETPALRRGKRLEPYICDMLTAEHGLQLVRRNERYADPEHPFLACEIDAETDDGQNVEIKTVHPFKAGEWGRDEDAIPVHYTAQAMHGLMITGRDACIFAALIGDDLRIYRVERDAEIIAGMRAREVAFWNHHILPRIPPAPRTADETLALFARDIGTSVEATEAVAAALDRLRGVRADIKAAEAAESELLDTIKAHMRDASNLTHNGRIIATWKTQTARRIDIKALETAHPDIAEQFKRASESRVFRIK
jgi:putative phage-type endonuclease